GSVERVGERLLVGCFADEGGGDPDACRPGGLQHLDVRRHFEAAPTTSRRRAPCERAPLALPQGERQGCGDRSRRGEKVAAVHGSSSCPSWDRTRTLLIQSQACCQLHQGAVFYMELRGLEPLTSWVRSRRSPSRATAPWALKLEPWPPVRQP